MNFPTFYNELAWRACDQMRIMFTVSGEAEKSLLHTLLHMIRKIADLRDFDRRQIAMDRQTGKTISETTYFESYLKPIIVSTCAKWLNYDETSSKCPALTKIWCGTHTTFSYLTL